MTGAEALRAIHGVGNRVGDALQAVQAVQDMLQGVTGMSQGVDSRVEDIGDEVINCGQTVQLPCPLLSFIYLRSRPRCRDSTNSSGIQIRQRHPSHP
jgi:hypothetical protein